MPSRRFILALVFILVAETAALFAFKDRIVFICVTSEYPVVSGPHASTHVTSYNVDSTEIEREYGIVRSLMGLEKIDSKVTVIKALAVGADGCIGNYGADRILGFYVSSLIVYDGTRDTLRHELVHFFYDHSSGLVRSEAVARLMDVINFNL